MLFGLSLFSQTSQNQNNSDEKFDYQFNGYIPLKRFDGTPSKLDQIWIAEKFRFNIIAERTSNSEEGEFDYVVFKLIRFSGNFAYVRELDDNALQKALNDIDLQAVRKIESLETKRDSIIKNLEISKYVTEEEVKKHNNTVDSLYFETRNKVSLINRNIPVRKDSIYQYANKIVSIKSTKENNWFKELISGEKISSYNYDYKENYIDVDDQDKMFWLKKDKFDKYLTQGYIKKRYQIPVQFAYGASLSIPFKIRPETKEQNIKITPEISLGGYFGLRKRLNRYKPIYLYLPVITAGVTTIGINSNNIIDESSTTPESSESINDGLVFARTFSVGSFIEFNSFQMGFVMGWDRPGGEVAKDWIYNDRLWYSFSIGYNFLRRNDNK